MQVEPKEFYLYQIMGMDKKKKITDIKSEIFIFGYLRQEMTQYAIPDELQILILTYSGNILLKLDVSSESKRKYVNGTSMNHIKATNLGLAGGNSTLVSWTGFGYGIHEVAIQIVNPAIAESIGIVWMIIKNIVKNV